MIGRADIEGSKSNVAMNAWLPQASYPCGTVVPCHFRHPKALGWLGLLSLGSISGGPDYILSFNNLCLIETDRHLVVDLHPIGFTTLRPWLRMIQSFAFLPYPRSLPWCSLLCFHVEAVAKALRTFPQFDDLAGDCSLPKRSRPTSRTLLVCS